MTGLDIFRYSGRDVRTVLVDSLVWFVLADLCAVLGLTNPSVVASRVDEAALSQTEISSGGQRRSVTIVNESGMYEVVIRSDKPEAVEFRRWITGTVLPAIRQTGSFAVAPMSRMELIDFARESELRAIAESERADRAETYREALEGADGLTLRGFRRKYMSDVKARDLEVFVYSKKLLANDPRGRGWDERGRRWRPGKTHGHPLAAGTAFFYLIDEPDPAGVMHQKPRVRRDRELEFVAYLERHGFRANRDVSAALFSEAS